MPITWPPIVRGRAEIRVGELFAKKGAVQVNPNMGRVGFPFTAPDGTAGLNAGFGKPASVAQNLRSLGQTFKAAESTALVNPNAGLNDQQSVFDGVRRRSYTRVLGSNNRRLVGISRDYAGVALGFCRVLIFETRDPMAPDVPGAAAGTKPPLFVTEVISDAGGNWSVTLAPKGAAYFIVYYLAGSPDRAGTTKNTAVQED